MNTETKTRCILTARAYRGYAHNARSKGMMDDFRDFMRIARSFVRRAGGAA